MKINNNRTRRNASRPKIKLDYITTDNVFTSLRLAKQLKGTTMLVGTMRGSRETIPHAFTTNTRKLYSGIQGKGADSGCTLLSSQVKNSNVLKVVHLLSAMHGIEAVPRYSSAKSAMLQFYNYIKFIDQTCCLYSSKADSRGLLVHVFSTILDIAVIRSRTIFEMTSD